MAPIRKDPITRCKGCAKPYSKSEAAKHGELLNCPHCGHQSPWDADAIKRKYPDAKACAKCKAIAPPDSTCCYFCGVDFSEQQPEAAPIKKSRGKYKCKACGELGHRAGSKKCPYSIKAAREQLRKERDEQKGKVPPGSPPPTKTVDVKSPRRCAFNQQHVCDEGCAAWGIADGDKIIARCGRGDFFIEGA